MTTGQAYNDFLDQLEQLYERGEALTIADWVFEKGAGLNSLQRHTHKHAELSPSAEKKISGYLRELLQHRPVQYVLGEVWFHKSKFFVNENVLIPRPETEELVGWAVENVRHTVFDQRRARLQILDIGTGSACIAISLKKELPDSQVTAIDVSESALSVAKKNAKVLQTPIDFVKIDFLDRSHWNALGMYDVIVSNPPYIPETEREKLAKNVAAFEPGIALFVRNNEPLIFYERIAEFGQSHLKANGKIFVEIHEDYSNEVSRVFKANNFKTEIKEDIYGKKRMIKVT